MTVLDKPPFWPKPCISLVRKQTSLTKWKAWHGKHSTQRYRESFHIGQAYAYLFTGRCYQCHRLWPLHSEVVESGAGKLSGLLDVQAIAWTAHPSFAKSILIGYEIAEAVMIEQSANLLSIIR